MMSENYGWNAVPAILCSALVSGLFLQACAPANGARNELLLSPAHDERINALTTAGSSSFELAGVKRVSVPGPPGEIFVIDQVLALQQRIAAGLSNVHYYDSDISIFRGFVSGDVVHLDISKPSATEILFIDGEPPIFVQLFNHVVGGGGFDGELDVRVHRFALDSCDSLDGRVDTLVMAVQQAAMSIGRRPVPSDTVVLDGRSFEVSIRMHDDLAAVHVGENSRRLFDPVNDLFVAVEACAEQRADFSLERYGF